MLSRILKITLPITILLGSLLIAFGLGNIEDATIIKSVSVNYGSFTWNCKTVDWHLYLTNLSNSLKNSGFNNILPNIPTLPNTPNNADILGWVRYIGSIMLSYVINWIIYLLNVVLLVPLKIILFPVHMILTILGINTSNVDYISTLINLYNFNIPYIPYF